MKISFCTTAMNRLEHLRQTLPRNLKDNPDAEFTVLNYGSPDGMDEWIKTSPETSAALDSGQLVYAYYPDATYFRLAHAKNMAHRLATGDVVCNLDADNYAGPGFARFLRSSFAASLDRTFVHVDFLAHSRLSRADQGVFGRMALSRKNFIWLGGYREDIRGWGGEDTNLLLRAVSMGWDLKGIDDSRYLESIAHDNKARVDNMPPEVREESTRRIERTRRWETLKLRWDQVSGWVQCNGGRFGEGLVLMGRDAKPVVFGPGGKTGPQSFRPACMGAIPYYKARKEAASAAAALPSL